MAKTQIACITFDYKDGQVFYLDSTGKTDIPSERKEQVFSDLLGYVKKHYQSVSQKHEMVAISSNEYQYRDITIFLNGNDDSLKSYNIGNGFERSSYMDCTFHDLREMVKLYIDELFQSFDTDAEKFQKQFRAFNLAADQNTHYTEVLTALLKYIDSIN